MDENMNTVTEVIKETTTKKSGKGGLIALAIGAGVAVVTTVVTMLIAGKAKTEMKELGEAIEKEDFEPDVDEDVEETDEEE